MATPPLPTFIIIGAQKSATRWLRQNLGLHPEIYTAASEISFFSSDESFEEQGVSWYRQQFEGWQGEPHVGEATPAYMMWRHRPDVVAGRIASVVPDATVMAILRNPVDRAHSAMVHHIADGNLSADADLLEIVRTTDPDTDPLGLVAGGWYAASLRPYREIFGDRLLVLLHDDLGTDPVGVYRAALRHIGARDDYLPDQLDRIRYSYQRGSPEQLAPAARRELYEHFRDDIRSLETMIGRDLSVWDPPADDGGSDERGEGGRITVVESAAPPARDDEESASTAATGPLPTFLIIGAQKSGTRWLRHNLGLHPDVCAASFEIGFFSSERYELGTHWYRAQFDGWSGEPIVGEATPAYMMFRHRPEMVAERIHHVVPDVRLVALLRNPVDRAQSAMVHHIGHERLRPGSRLVDLAAAVLPRQDPLTLVVGGWYAASLEPYMKVFGDQLLVLLHDDVRSDPAGVYRTVLAHIGASPEFVPPELSQVRYSNERRARRVTHDLTQAERSTLYEYFRSDLRALEPMLGRDLVGWKPHRISDTVPVVLGRRRFPDWYERAADWVAGLARGLTREQLSLDTVCSPWTVADILDHLAGITQSFADALLRDAPPPAPLRYSDDPAVVPLRAASRAFLDAMQRPDRASHEETVSTSRGELTIIELAGAAFIELLAHGWDIARATGQDATIPGDLLGIVEQSAGTGRISRPEGQFAAEVAVSPTATATERFVAHFGRDPAAETG